MPSDTSKKPARRGRRVAAEEGKEPSSAHPTVGATDAPPDEGPAVAAEDASDATAKPAAAKKKKAPARKRVSRAKKAAPFAIPVLVVDETLLLPHMSIPYPIEDEESAMVIDRASRIPSHLLLVLTERPVPRAADPESSGATAETTASDGEFRDLVADAVADTLGVSLDAAEDADAAESPPEEGEWTPDEELPVEEYELCPVGVIAEVGQRISRPGGNAHVILQGIARGVVTEIVQDDPYVVARVKRSDDAVDTSPESEAAMSAVLEQVESYISMLPNVPEEVLTMIRGVDEPGWLADLIAFSPEFSPDQRQELLELTDPVKRLRRLSIIVQKRLNVLQLRRQIQHEAQEGMDKQQREYFLREQMRAIQKELGEGSSEEAVANELRTKIEEAGMPEEAKEKALVQLQRLEQQHPLLPRDRRHPLLPGVADRAALVDPDRGPARPRRGRRDPGAGPPRARQGQGAHRRVHRRPQAGRR